MKNIQNRSKILLRMMDINSLSRYSVLFIIGGLLYFSIEILWRQYSYFSMFVLGGLCFTTVGIMTECLTRLKSSLLIQQFIATLIIISLELIFGLVLNVKLGLGVWDYSDVKFNFMGQICLKYSMFWFLLSLPTIVLYNYLNHWLFKYKKPYYKYI